jgi:ligand-binding sensor domain-containing protein
MMKLSAAIGAAFALVVTAGAAQAQRVKDSYEVGPSVYVRALTVEPARGALWVGTSAGVHEVDLASGKLRSTFTRKDGLANEYVFAVGLDRDGNKWFGTNAGGVSRYKDGQWKTFFPMHGLADYWVYSFAQQRKGDFWIGTWAGVNRVDAKSGKFSTYVKELVNEWVYGISVDALDRVWFGTEGGVTMYDGKAWRSWTHKDGLGAANTEQLPIPAWARACDTTCRWAAKARRPTTRTTSSRSWPRPTAASGPAPGVAARRAGTASAGPT